MHAIRPWFSFKKICITVFLQISRCLAVHYQIKKQTAPKTNFKHRLVTVISTVQWDGCACLASTSFYSLDSVFESATLNMMCHVQFVSESFSDCE